MTDTLKKEFWDRLEDTRTGMLSADTARAVPMTHYVDDDDHNVIWFITSKGTDLSKVATLVADGEYIVSNDSEHLYARINGRVSLSQDAAKLEDIWSRVADAWFEGGRQDPDVQLVRFDLSEAEIWITGGSLTFLFEIAKAQVSDKKPDMGEHGILQFN